MADKTIGSVLYATDGSRVDYDTAANLDATFRDVSAETAAVRAELGASVDGLASRVGAVEAGNSGGGALPPGGTSGQTIVKQSDGSAAWADPTGMPGRGIASIVASTADPTTATVTYTDGTTAALTLPQGAAGRSIDSFGAPDGEGVSVVTFSDGSTTTITLPEGPQGETGPAPTVSWTGDVLTVDGKASPPLTGPASTTPGPAPSIKIGTVTSGVSPSASITGTSPDLTLDLVLPKGDKGDAGAAQDARIITGPGRPDTPSTTGGVITGSEPVGAEYRSTDGANVGAYVWMKRPGGKWEVAVGDTGVRRLTDPAFTGTIGGNGIYLRRIGATVTLTLADQSTSAAGDKWFLASRPAGFNPAANTNAVVIQGENAAYGRLLVAAPGIGPAMARLQGPAGNWNGYARYETSQPWPTAPLPGSPA